MSEDLSTLQRVVDVRRVWVPLTLLGTAAMTLISGTLVYARIAEHTSNPQLHLNPERVTEGGGLAYRNDITQVENDLKWAMIEQAKHTRKLLRGATLTCVRHSPSGECMTWKIELPDETE